MARYYRVLAELERQEYERLREQARANEREIYQEATFLLKRALDQDTRHAARGDCAPAVRTTNAESRQGGRERAHADK
jgi:hypothetical protein